jgi:hypothetical protein
MKNTVCLLILFGALLGAWSSNTASAQNKKFLESASGRWTGTLEYADYQTGKRVKLKTNLSIVASADGNSASFSYVYDDFGKIMKSEAAHRIDRAAKKYFIGNDEFSFEESAGKIVLRGEQTDGERLEPVRTTITFSPDELTILKETRTPPQFRHQYTFRRAAEFEPEKTLSPAQMAEDFGIFKRAVSQLHPGLYRYNTPPEIENDFAELEAKIKNALPEGEFFKLLAQFANRLGCGHTYLNPLNQTKLVRARLFERKIYFPFYFRLIDRRMIVTGNLSSKNLSVGSEITRVNGIPVARIIDSLLTATIADGRGTIASRLKSLELKIARENQYQPFDIYFPLFFPAQDEVFQIEAIDYAGKKPMKFQIPAMTRAERFAESEKRFGKTPDYDEEWQFEIRENSTARLKIGNSLTWRLKRIDYKKFIAEAFAEMRAKNIKNLIIDWRGNDGGDDDLNVELIKYLAKKPVACADPKKRFVRVSEPDKDLTNYIEVFDQQTRRFLTEGVPANLIKKSAGDLYEFLGDAPCEIIEPAENNFTGNAYVISDASNASAAFQFLRAVKANRLAAIVGQTSGGNLQGINGDNYFLLRLPNSTFEMDIPVYFLAPLAPEPDSGVAPDVEIKRRARDVAAGIDAELNYILKRIKNR